MKIFIKYVLILFVLFQISETKNQGLDKLIDYIKEIAAEGSDGVDHVIKPDHSIKISDFLPLDMKTQTFYSYKVIIAGKICVQNLTPRAASPPHHALKTLSGLFSTRQNQFPKNKLKSSEN